MLLSQRVAECADLFDVAPRAFIRAASWLRSCEDNWAIESSSCARAPVALIVPSALALVLRNPWARRSAAVPYFCR